MNLQVSGALVTHLKPLVADASPTTDPAGFFVQATPTGPAIFLQVDPATYGVARGDVVHFTATQVARVNGLVTVLALSAFTRTASAVDLTTFPQSVGSVDFSVSTTQESYESELLSFSGTLSSDMVAAGFGYQAATINTTGSTGTALRLRIPNAVQSVEGFSNGCTVAFNGGPLWRYQGQAQASVWSSANLTGSSCPSPSLMMAGALSANSVRLTFNRPMNGAGLNSGSVSIPGLTVSSVSGSGTSWVASTSSQTPGANYTATISASVTDVRGSVMSSSGRSAAFTGFTQPVGGLVINEINYDSVGDDSSADEFIEIFNGSGVTQSLADRSVVLVNGSTSTSGASYRTIDLSSAGSLSPGEYLVIVGSTTTAVVASGAKIVQTAAQAGGWIQNGPSDAVVLVATSTLQVLDAVSYEGSTNWVSTAGTVNAYETAGSTAAESNSVADSLSRLPNGIDSDDNTTDFVLTTSPTPGAANQ
ncbi:MAG: hypothetical protein DI536_26520 [Archangium gephyra]|uniref:LTD domain-containing protein n=1 Tax=Archangium gephyra TaxID=48 RepID=A0A2W5T5Y0_9BACT|nr:MAG: hypothetical protein DI536_26520 [Archangium gephyra]